MQLYYLQFASLADLKRFRDALPAKRVFIMLEQKILLASFSEKEIEMAVEEFAAEVIGVPVA